VDFTDTEPSANSLGLLGDVFLDISRFAKRGPQRLYSPAEFPVVGKIE
jgi:hypothetical protein